MVGLIYSALQLGGLFSIIYVKPLTAVSVVTASYFSEYTQSYFTSLSWSQNFVRNNISNSEGTTADDAQSVPASPRTLCWGASGAGRTSSDVTAEPSSMSSTVTASSTTPRQEITDPPSKELISVEVYSKAQPVMEKMTTFFGATALVVNSVNVVVLFQKSMRSPTSAYLVALSVTEFLYVLLDFIPDIHGAVIPLSPASYFYLTYGLFVSNYVMVVLGRFTYCLTTLVCSERFFALAFPLRAKRSALIKSPLAVIVACAASLFLCHFYIALKYEVYPSVVLENGEILYAFRFTDAYASNMAALDKWALVNKVIFVYVVLLLGLVVNVMLVVALHRHRRSRQEMMTSDDTNIRKRQEREITITILVSSLVFTTLGLPIASNSLAGQVLPPGSYGFFSARCHTFLFVQLVGSTLFALSFSTDFCTFVIFSSAYRVTLRRVLARVVRLEKRVSEKKGAGSSQDYTKNSDISSVETQY